MDLAPYLEKKGIALSPRRPKRVHADKNQIELVDGKTIDYDFLIIATGPKLAFDEVRRLRPQRRPHQLDLHRQPCRRSRQGLDTSSSRIPATSSSAPCRARRATVRPTSSP